MIQEDPFGNINHVVSSHFMQHVVHIVYLNIKIKIMHMIVLKNSANQHGILTQMMII